MRIDCGSGNTECQTGRLAGTMHVLERPTRQDILESSKTRPLVGREFLLGAVELQPERIRTVGDQCVRVPIAELRRRP